MELDLLDSKSDQGGQGKACRAQVAQPVRQKVKEHLARVSRMCLRMDEVWRRLYH